MRSHGSFLPLLPHECAGMGIKHRKGPWHRKDSPGSPLPSPISNQLLVIRMLLLVSSPPGPTDPWLCSGMGLASPHPSHLFLVYPSTALQPRRDKSIAGLSLGTLQPDTWHHCPHSHVSPSEGASLALAVSCRHVHGGVSGAACCSPGAPHIWNVGPANLISHCSGPSWETMASFTYHAVERVALLLQRSWGQTPTVAAVPTILPETTEVTAPGALWETGTHS